MKPLTEAARKGDVKKIQSLISKGSKVDEITREVIIFGKNIISAAGCTPLMVAVGEGHIEAVTALLEAGANPNHQANDGITALHLAALLDHDEIIPILTKYQADLNARMKPSETPLLSALSLDRYRSATALVQAGADVTVKDGYMQDTPLHRAVYTAEFYPLLMECVHKLIDAGADVNARNTFQGETPLHYAAASGFPEIVDLLLEKGANVNKTDSMNRTPIFKAYDNPEIIRQFIQSGADMNHADRFGQTVLFQAVRNAELESIRQLARSGANLNHKDQDGKTVLMLAAESNKQDVLNLLRKFGATVEFTPDSANTFLCNACKQANASKVRELLKKGADPNATHEWKPALLIAVEASAEAVVRALLNAGASVDRGTSGETPLHVACVRGSTTIVQALLDAGAKVDAIDADGTTPLMRASEGGNPEVIRLLLAKKADVHRQAKDKTTALLIAARHGNGPAAELLIAAGAKHRLAQIFLERIEFPHRLKQKGVQEAIRDLSKICGVKPLKEPSHFRGGIFFDLSKTPIAKRMRTKTNELRALGKAIHSILDRFQTRFLKRGCLLLFVHQLPGDKLALLPTTNPYTAVAWLGPHPKGPVHMIEFLLKLSTAYRWTLRGCSYDQLQIQFQGKPANPQKLADLLYSLRSDEKGITQNGVDVLAESKKEFANFLASKDPIVRLWWD